MTDKNAIRFLAFSLYPLALSVFVSVSLIPIYHALTLITFFALLHRKEINLNNLPKSALALSAFVGIQILSVLINFSTMEDMGHSLGSLKYPLFGVIGLILFQNKKVQENEYLKKHARCALNVFLLTILVAFIYSVIKVYSGLDFFHTYYQAIADGKDNTRFRGFTEIMRYGYGTALALLLLLACLLNLKKIMITKTPFLILVLIAGFIGVYLSYTRGSLVGLLVGVPVVLYYFNKRITMIVTALSALLLASVIAISLMGGDEHSRFLQKSDSRSNRMRESQYLAAIYAITQKPILGFGPQQLKFHIKEIKQQHNLEFPDFESHAHNIYLQIAADSGIVGLIAFLLWLGLWTKEIFLTGNNFAKQMFLPLIMFLLVPGQFEMLFMAQTSTLIFFIYALSQLNVFKKETV